MGTESLAWFLIVIAVFGLIVGAIGRLLVPGATRLGLVETMGAGVVGALLGGFVGRLLLGPRLTQGWIWVLSILGAALVVAVVSRRGGAGSWRYPRRRPTSDRVYDDYDDRRVVDDRRLVDDRRGYGASDRGAGISRRGWSPSGLMGRARGGQARMGDVDRSYAAPARRRRRFF